MIAANLSDIAVLELAVGENSAWRRGWMHGALAIAALPLPLATASVALVRAQVRRGGRLRTRAPVRFGGLRLLAVIGLVPHFPAQAELLAAAVYAPQLFSLKTLKQYRKGFLFRGQIDWECLLAPNRTDTGFDHSVLCEFPGRPVTHGAGERLLAQFLDAARADGLLKAPGRQRSDSTHVLAAACCPKPPGARSQELTPPPERACCRRTELAPARSRIGMASRLRPSY